MLTVNESATAAIAAAAAPRQTARAESTPRTRGLSALRGFIRSPSTSHASLTHEALAHRTGPITRVAIRSSRRWCEGTSSCVASTCAIQNGSSETIHTAGRDSFHQARATSLRRTRPVTADSGTDLDARGVRGARRLQPCPLSKHGEAGGVADGTSAVVVVEEHVAVGRLRPALGEPLAPPRERTVAVARMRTSRAFVEPQEVPVGGAHDRTALAETVGEAQRRVACCEHVVDLVGKPGVVARFERDAYPARKPGQRLLQPSGLDGEVRRQLEQDGPELVFQPARVVE